MYQPPGEERTFRAFTGPSFRLAEEYHPQASSSTGPADRSSDKKNPDVDLISEDEEPLLPPPADSELFAEPEPPIWDQVEELLQEPTEPTRDEMPLLQEAQPQNRDIIEINECQKLRSYWIEHFENCQTLLVSWAIECRPHLPGDAQILGDLDHLSLEATKLISWLSLKTPKFEKELVLEMMRYRTALNRDCAKLQFKKDKVMRAFCPEEFQEQDAMVTTPQQISPEEPEEMCCKDFAASKYDSNLDAIIGEAIPTSPSPFADSSSESSSNEPLRKKPRAQSTAAAKGGKAAAKKKRPPPKAKRGKAAAKVLKRPGAQK